MTEPWEIRRDLMTRWFAVAISVGFATTLVHMQWLNSGGLPDAAESQQLARLLAALVAVVFSWEGYFSSIGKKKLTTASRFYIDFSLVLLYMVLLYTSRIPAYWIYIHSFSFILYVCWDVLTIRQYRDDYVKPSVKQTSTPWAYIGSTLGWQGYYRGPFVTLIWGIYFAGFSALQYVMQPRNSWALLPFVLIPLYLYRQDKRRAADDWKAGSDRYSGIKTAALIILLWAILYAVFYYYHGPALGAPLEKCATT